MTALPQDSTLDDIRRDIDAIDDRILDLIAQRLAASARVRRVKSQMAPAASPIRPAREAAILRRLMAKRPPDVDPQQLVRLWRVILTSSTLAQAPVAVHLTDSTARDPQLRAQVADHFCAMPVTGHAAIGDVIDHLAHHPGDIGVVQPVDAWAAGLDKGLRVMGRLPALTRSQQPLLLVLGHGEAQDSGDDETVLVGPVGVALGGKHDLLWRTQSSGLPVFGVRGFLESAPGSSFVIAGQYPRPLEE